MSDYKPFEPLVKRIKEDGKCLPGGILKVDSFINHQIDPTLLQSMSIEFVRRFASVEINKILTIEASGIAPAVMVGFLLNVPVVLPKRRNLQPWLICWSLKFFPLPKTNLILYAALKSI